MITLLLLIPILGALLIAPMQEGTPEQEARMKRLALGITLANFVLSMVLWGEFDSNSSQYQFTTEWNSVNFCHLTFGVDGLSLYFVLLTTFTMPICILASWSNVRHNMKYFLIAFLLLESMLIALFVVLDLLLFYIFFEAVLIPLFLIVGIWGGSETRVRASFLLFLYTLFGSLFMLLAFLVIYYNVGSTDFQILSLADLSFSNVQAQRVLWLAIFLGFAIKTPLVPFHLWLPRAHAESPLAGSMVLAGLVLKMATYGFVRILIPFLPEATAYFTPLVQTIAVITIVYSSLTTLRQTDIKCLVAYSSVAHMGVVILGLFSNTVSGIEGGLLLSIAHGFVSPALFMLVGGVIYDRYHTRVIRYYRGLTLYMPLFSLLFFLFILGNIGTPLTLNWVGEFLALTGTFQRSPLVAMLAATSIVLSAAYSIWVYNRVAFGSFSPYLSYTIDLTRREFMVLLPFLICTFLFGFFPNIILEGLHYPVSTLIYSFS